MMTRYLIGAAAVALAGAAFAQGMQPPTVQTPRIDMPSNDRPMNDRVQTRAEVVAKVQKHFAMLDRNHDGYITADEMPAMGGMGHGDHDMAMRDGPMPDANAMFDRLDTNRDGTISRDEFARGHQMRIERQVVINGGGPDGDRREMKMHGMGGRMGGAGLLKMADTNNDGRITLQEMTAAALAKFDRADTNRDGRVTQDERKAMRMQMHDRTGG